MELSHFKEQLLALLTLDYEQINTIENEFAEALGYKPSAKEIIEGLITLESEGFVSGYQYKNERNEFVPVDVSSLEIEAIWFMATPKGRAANEE